MTIEVKNDEMLGRTNDTTLHIELMKLQQENQQLKEDYNKVVHEATEFESKVYELEEVINKTIHRIQLLQMDGEVTIRDLGLIVRDLKGENK